MLPDILENDGPAIVFFGLFSKQVFSQHMNSENLLVLLQCKGGSSKSDL